MGWQEMLLCWGVTVELTIGVEVDVTSYEVEGIVDVVGSGVVVVVVPSKQYKKSTRRVQTSPKAWNNK